MLPSWTSWASVLVLSIPFTLFPLQTSCDTFLAALHLTDYMYSCRGCTGTRLSHSMTWLVRRMPKKRSVTPITSDQWPSISPVRVKGMSFSDAQFNFTEPTTPEQLPWKCWPITWFTWSHYTHQISACSRSQFLRSITRNTICLRGGWHDERRWGNVVEVEPSCSVVSA